MYWCVCAGVCDCVCLLLPLELLLDCVLVTLISHIHTKSVPAPSHRTSRAFGFVSNETRHWKHSKQITYGSAVHQKTAFKVSTRSIAYQQPMRDNARVPTAFTASDFEKSVRDVDTELCSIAYKRIYALSFITNKMLVRSKLEALWVRGISVASALCFHP